MTDLVVTESGDPINFIRDSIYDAFTGLTGSGNTFAGFVVEKFQDPYKGFTAPGITIQLNQSPGTTYGLGAHRENRLTVRTDLIFKDGHSKTIGATTLYRDELAQWYLPRVMDVLDDATITGVKLIGREVSGQTHTEPQEGSNRYLYGCIATLDTSYEGDIA